MYCMYPCVNSMYVGRRMRYSTIAVSSVVGTGCGRPGLCDANSVVGNPSCGTAPRKDLDKRGAGSSDAITVRDETKEQRHVYYKPRLLQASCIDFC